MDKRIEAFLNNELSEQEVRHFEEEMQADKKLADELAFFLSVKKIAGENPRARELDKRHQEWTRLPATGKTVSIQQWFMSAAAVLAVVLGLVWVVTISKTPDLKETTSAYINDQFQTLSVQMGGTQDSLQTAMNAYNNGKPAETLQICEQILNYNPGNSEALRVGGIAALKLENYDKAIKLFNDLGNLDSLFGNPGRFYEAIARLQQGSEENRKQAETLLKEVVSLDLEGKMTAEKWIGKN